MGKYAAYLYIFTFEVIFFFKFLFAHEVLSGEMIHWSTGIISKGSESLVKWE